jgi:pre-rRNA-processing protein TSR4
MELGFLDESDEGLLLRSSSSEWVDWDGGLAGGAEPLWLAPPNEPSRSLVVCSRCQHPMTFLVQVYAPLDDFPQAFHRDLCVFFCTRCPVSCLESAVCIRLQLDEKNPYYPGESDELAPNWPVPDRSSWTIYGSSPRATLEKRYALLVETVEEKELKIEDFEDDDDEDAASQAKKGPQPCEICSKPTSTRCSACRSVFYCCREHQAEHWSKGGHKAQCKDLQDARVTQKELDQSAAMGDVRVQSRLEKDAYFDRFVAQTKSHPDQVLRYRRWHDNAELWTARKHRLESRPPNCERCGAERKFEMQVTPQFMNHFGSDLERLEALKCDLDFGAIVVYSCTKSCGATNEGECLKEFTYCQPAGHLGAAPGQVL